MKTFKLLIISLFVVFLADAHAGSYNYNSGNSYISSGSSYQGYNTRTGSRWSTTYTSSGSSGLDSKGNRWSYDRNTGRYQNYGTGETRIKGKKVTTSW